MKFAADVHLGKLARHLRMLGFDVFWKDGIPDAELARVAEAGCRTLLTRDRALAASHGVAAVESGDPEAQLRAVIAAHSLKPLFKPLTRCLDCNALLEPVAKEKIVERLPENTKKFYDEFLACPGCGRVYWKGSHYGRMMELVKSLS